MERLTYEKSPKEWGRGKYPNKYTSQHTFQEVVARLAAYEDTGLEPEEIKEVQEAMEPIPFGRFRDIMEAERAGRLVVLPDDKARWIKAILAERKRQDQKWGYPQKNSYCEWASILAEEVGELAKELNEMNFGRGRRDHMEEEAVQVAAVALSILEQSAIAHMVTEQVAVSLGRLTSEETDAALKKREEADNEKSHSD